MSTTTRIVSKALTLHAEGLSLSEALSLAIAAIPASPAAVALAGRIAEAAVARGAR